MVFNASKSELMRFILGKERGYNFLYVAPDGSIIERKQQLRDLGMIMSNTANYGDQIG